jgi:ATP-dependent DNA helicase RecG
MDQMQCRQVWQFVHNNAHDLSPTQIRRPFAHEQHFARVASACVLMYATGESGKLDHTARARLKVMAQTNDGFEIAKQDLEIRGPGEFLGARQSGVALLHFADLITDAQLLQTARQLAPHMLDQHNALAEKHIARWLGGRVDYLKA